MYIYIDESIHDRADFIVVAAVCSAESLQPSVEDALRDSGFEPMRDEFKSSMKMGGNPNAQRLRDRLQGILRQSHVAVAVCSVSERPMIVELAGTLLSCLAIDADELPTTVYFDGGMAGTLQTFPKHFEAVRGCNSRKIAGIQVADCAAHLVSMMLLTELGLLSKTVPARVIYPEDDGEIELGWTLWASVRHALASGSPIGGYDDEGWCEPMMHPFGLLVSDRCSNVVKSAIEKRLSTVWVGCIH